MPHPSGRLVPALLLRQLVRANKPVQILQASGAGPNGRWRSPTSVLLLHQWLFLGAQTSWLRRAGPDHVVIQDRPPWREAEQEDLQRPLQRGFKASCFCSLIETIRGVVLFLFTLTFPVWFHPLRPKCRISSNVGSEPEFVLWWLWRGLCGFSWEDAKGVVRAGGGGGMLIVFQGCIKKKSEGIF